MVVGGTYLFQNHSEVLDSKSLPELKSLFKREYEAKEFSKAEKILIQIEKIAPNSNYATSARQALNKRLDAHVSSLQLIDTKIERKGNRIHKIDLYTYSSRELNINELKKLCSDNKSSFRTGTDYHLVVFKNKKNASFPDSPITAEYGFEQEKIEHIKARYTYYRGNGYSVLDIYEKNMWESVAEEIKI